MTVLSRVIIHLFVNLIAIGCIFLILDWFGILLSSDFCSWLVLGFTIANSIFLLRSIDRLDEYHPSLLKAFPLVMLMLVSMFFEFEFAMQFMFEIDLTVSMNPVKILSMLIIYSIIALVIGYFFRSRKSKENRKDDSVLNG